MVKNREKIIDMDGESGGKEDQLPTRASPPDTWVVDGEVGSTNSLGLGLGGTLYGSSSRRRYRSPSSSFIVGSLN